MSRLNALALVSCLALGTLGFAAPASAAEARFASQRVVHADLDLNREAGAATMLRRIDSAARAACGVRNGPMTLIDRQMQRQCVTAKQQRAVTRLNRSAVTALYYNRHPSIVIAG